MNSSECGEMPEALRKKLEAEGIDPAMVICWRKIKKNKVVITYAKVLPSSVLTMRSDGHDELIVEEERDGQ